MKIRNHLTELLDNEEKIVYRHKWEKNDLIFQDNLANLHFPTAST